MFKTLVFFVTFFVCACGWSSSDFNKMVQAKQGLYDLVKPETLGLKAISQAQSIVAFKAIEHTHQYNHGAVLFPFKGRLYLQWQSSKVDEDAPETQVMMSVSETGEHWGSAITLVPARKDAVVTNGGWWSNGDVLIAYINVWPNGLSPRGGHVEYISSQDGVRWSSPKPVVYANGSPVLGVIEQDLKALPNGRILTAVHLQPGLTAKPFYTDDPLGVSGWNVGKMQNLPHKPEISRELEPSGYLAADGRVVMVFRDQGGSYRVLASVSEDNGATWSVPYETTIPDSRAKQSAGTLPSRSNFLVNNPTGEKRRSPLVLSLSRDGFLFDRAYLLRQNNDLPAMRFSGKYKRAGYSYPKSIVWAGFLWVSYAVNKEDIAVTRIPLTSLEPFEPLK